jgi:hypothetical protein
MAPQAPPLTHNSQWVIVSFKRPFLWVRHIGENGEPNETWNMLPGTRYVLNANQLPFVEDYIEGLSDLKNAALHSPMHGQPVNITGAKVLVDRYRDRGIGDLLFMTGPLSYLHHLSGATCKLHVYTSAQRGPVFQGHPAIHNQTPIYGPLVYDTFPNYHYHWLVDTLTEYDQERDQLNVYDALYQQLGLPYGSIDPKFKRPSMTLSTADLQNFGTFCYFVFHRNKDLDLRRKGFYVVAPLSHSTIRSAQYGLWLEVVQELAKRRPVVVVGQVTDRMPTMDMGVDEFCAKLNVIPDVVNMIGGTPLRTLAAIISKAVAVVSLDSGPLYLAQALRVPAVSLWGPHHPGVRIGYDKNYMDLAIWNQVACRQAPCFAYAGFPAMLCPHGAQQTVCEVLSAVSVAQVTEKVSTIEVALRWGTTTAVFSRPSAVLPAYVATSPSGVPSA